MIKLEKAQANLAREISNLKAEVKHIKRQWERSAFEIKDNILAQAQVICPEADFSTVSLDKHVVNGHIEDVPKYEEEEESGDAESDRTQCEAEPFRSFLLYFFVYFVFCVAPFVGFM